MKKLWAIILATTVGISCLTACNSDTKDSQPKSDLQPSTTESQPQKDNQEISVTDMQGNTIILQDVPQRIVVMTPGDCEILYALGVGENIVGRGTYCNYPQEVQEITSVESGAETNVEQLIALQPDVVIMNTMAQSEETIQSLKKAGANVVLTEAPSIADTYQLIALLGQVTGKETEAATLVKKMQQDFETLRSKVQQGEKKTVYFEVSPLKWGLWTAGSDTFMTEIAQMLGVENVFSDVSGWAEISQEQILQRNPDYIITNTRSDGEEITPMEEILSRKGWQELKAVQNKQVLIADPDIISRPGPRLVEAAELMYGFFYE